MRMRTLTLPFGRPRRSTGADSRAPLTVRVLRPRIRALLALAALFAVACAYGAARLGSLRLEDGPRLAVIQPNILHTLNNPIGTHTAQTIQTERLRAIYELTSTLTATSRPSSPLLCMIIGTRRSITARASTTRTSSSLESRSWTAAIAWIRSMLSRSTSGTDTVVREESSR